MSAELRNPNDTIDNLAIGKIIEVDGSHIVFMIFMHSGNHSPHLR